MPELPEVEVVKRSLEKKILNMIIKKVKINDGNLRYKINKVKISRLVGKRIIKIKRRSKFLIFKISEKYVMLIHLGMTGKFFYINKERKKFKTSFYYNIDQKKDQKYDRIVFYLQNQQKLIYNDVRKFGFIKILNQDEIYKNFHLKNLGPEPLKKNFNYNYLKHYIFGRERMVKDLLMDQKCVSGLGNIYVNEILFSCNINPFRKVKTLKNFEIKKIVKNTKKILNKSIRLGGSSIKNFSSYDGKKGEFQQQFKVYGREDKKCSNIDCNKSITRSVISNRASFFCKSCQK